MYSTISVPKAEASQHLTTAVIVVDDARRSRGGAAQVPITHNLASTAGRL